MSFQELETILHPSSVAVVGASTNTFSFGFSYPHHLVEYGFNGPIYLVNPNYPEIMGLKTYPSVKAIPGTGRLRHFLCQCLPGTGHAGRFGRKKRQMRTFVHRSFQ